MSSVAFETALARLYADGEFRDLFLRSSDDAIALLGLSEKERAALLAIDRKGLEMAGASFARKRSDREAKKAGRR